MTQQFSAQRSSESERFEFYEEGLALRAFRLGLISSSSLAKYDLYKTYLEFLEKFGDDTDARRMTMQVRRASYLQVARAIYFFSSFSKPGKQDGN